MRTSRRFTRPPAHIRGPARRCFSRLGLVSFRFVMASSRGRERAQQRGPRVFVFGSSTPRDLSHMNKVGPRSPAPTPPDSHPPQEVRRPDSQGEQRRPEPQRLHAEGQVPDPGRWAVSPFFSWPESILASSLEMQNLSGWLFIREVCERKVLPGEHNGSHWSAVSN